MLNHASRATTWTRVRGKFGGNRSKESGRSGVWFTSHKIVTILRYPIGYRIADNDPLGDRIADNYQPKPFYFTVGLKAQLLHLDLATRGLGLATQGLDLRLGLGLALPDLDLGLDLVPCGLVKLH